MNAMVLTIERATMLASDVVLIGVIGFLKIISGC